MAVIRLSGPGVRACLETVAGSVSEPRRLVLRTVRDVRGAAIDRALVAFFKAPESFTGEDCAELHVHGGRAVIAATLSLLAGFDGFRSAEPGEFARRAFDNGRMDLVEVEGLADLISAETEAQRRMAADQASGGLSALYEGWREKIARARALIEADFDFADEDDVPGTATETVWPMIAVLAGEIDRHLAGARAGEIVRGGYRIVIVGAPNAGKSSLLNALARRDIAIVSKEMGTTRDVLETRLDIGGYPAIVQDTAGLREAAGEVEREGVRRALAAMRAADLVLLLRDLGGGAANVPLPEGRPVLKVGSKADLASAQPAAEHDCLVSARTGEGLESLIALLEKRIAAAAGIAGDAVANRQRHREHLERCLAHLRAALDNPALPPELRSESLRQAGDCLGRLTGRIDVEELLDLIFAEFCIGK